jgi:rhodanese-related sulfurtransferase
MLTKATYTPKPRPGEINLDEFKQYAAVLPPNVMIIDARTVGEAKSGTIPTAKLIPAEEIKERAVEIPKDKLVVFYCNTGVIAEVAYNTLKSLGYTNTRFVNAKVDFDKKGSYTISKD